jgi:hypothetical protein
LVWPGMLRNPLSRTERSTGPKPRSLMKAVAGVSSVTSLSD